MDSKKFGQFILKLRYLFFCFYALLSYWADRFRLRKNKDSRMIFSAVRSSIPLCSISLTGWRPMKTQKNTGKNASTLP